MFTGIVQAIGTLVERQPLGGDLRLAIAAPGFFRGTRAGDSIAVGGICLTAVDVDDDRLLVDVSGETLAATTAGGWEAGRAVNLERALTPSTPLGGHLVSGHVDGVGRLLGKREDARSWRMEFEAPAGLARYVARKGSICIDGVSLTVNDVSGATFGVNIIPHTLTHTTLGRLAAGDAVNLEADLVARYLERLLEARGS